MPRAWVACLLFVCILTTPLLAQQVTTAPASQPVVSAQRVFGLGVIAPALVAIILAIATRQVIVALSLGTLTASTMICILHADYNPIHAVTMLIDRYVLGVLAPMKDGRVDLEHLTILIYTLFIGAMIGVLNANGGTRAVVAAVTRRVASRRSAQLAAFGSGLAVFFDDYASAMIVGPGLRPIFDRLRISREKLAHIVNWTAAPVSSMFLGTWLAVQIGWIDAGIKNLGADAPPFVAGETAAHVFWASIPYRTYSVMVLVAVFLIGLTGRDWGAMRKSESAAIDGEVRTDGDPARPPEPATHWMLGFLPAFVLVGLTVGLMLYTGWAACEESHTTLTFGGLPEIWKSAEAVLGKADSHAAMLYASLFAAVVAILMTVLGRQLTLARTIEGAVSGMTAMFAASIILVLAWGLSLASKDLELGPTVGQFLRDQKFPAEWLPLAIFIASCVISFSTGSAWTTMGILIPVAIAISCNLLGPSRLPNEEAHSIFLSCIGSVMAGAVFGNTCSPLADVTVLSAMFSGCDLGQHVRTVTPYAILVALVGILSTDGLHWAIRQWAPNLGWSVWYGLGAGTMLLVIWLLVVGRRPKGVVFEPAVEMGS